MTKRKIWITEMLFFLLMFAILVVLSPRNANAAVKVTTKGTSSTIVDENGVIDDFFDEIEFPIRVQNDNYVKRTYKVTIRLSFYSEEGILPKSTTFSIDGEDVIKIKTPEYSPAVYKETFFTYDDSLDYGLLEFDFRGKEHEKPVICGYEITIKKAVPEISLNNYQSKSLSAGSTAKVNVQITDPYVKNISRSKLKVTSSNTSVLKVNKITQASSNSKKFTVTLKGIKSGAAKITAAYPNAKSQTIKVTVTKPPKTVATFRSSKTTLRTGSRITMRSLITLKGGTTLTIKSAKSSKPSVVAISGNYLVPKKTGTAVITAKLNGVSRKITITVYPKPTVSQIKASVTKIQYQEERPTKVYITAKFKNTSKFTVKSVKVRMVWEIAEEVVRYKTVTLNLKPGASKTVRIDAGPCIEKPDSCKIKCLSAVF